MEKRALVRESAAYGFKKFVNLFEAIDLFEVKRANSIILVRIAKVGGKKGKLKVAAKDFIDDDDDVPF